MGRTSRIRGQASKADDDTDNDDTEYEGLIMLPEEVHEVLSDYYSRIHYRDVSTAGEVAVVDPSAESDGECADV